MAKLHGFRCDRCGAEYDKNRSKNDRDKTGYNVIGFAFVNTAKQLDRYDLCDDCINKLQLWIKYSNINFPMVGVDLASDPDTDEEVDEETEEE